MVLKQSIIKLPIDMQLALHFRFWELMTIEEIAKVFRIPWAEANKLIEEAKKKLSKYCLANKTFSLSNEQEMEYAGQKGGRVTDS